jgi:hypothetical protein
MSANTVIYKVADPEIASTWNTAVIDRAVTMFDFSIALARLLTRMN